MIEKNIMGFNFSRLKLYNMVWSKPLWVLAKEIGVSDVAVGKACRRAGVPRPGLGYWAKKKAGKSTKKLPLPLRFPGASESVSIGQQYYYHNQTILSEEDEVPPPPIFEEEQSNLEERVQKIVGKVSFPTLSNRTHPIIAKFLEQDEERNKEYLRYNSSWNEPKFNSSIEKRRLRILNAIFIHCQNLGCKSNMSTSKYDHENRNASITVGETYVSFELRVVEEKKSRIKPQKKIKKRLSLSISSSKQEKNNDSWIDNDESKIESFLKDICIKLIVNGEMQYRESQNRQYEWMLERRNELIEENRQKKIEAERKSRELFEQQEREKLQCLLDEATALQQAKTIRTYVKSIQDIKDISVSENEINQWALWALKQADRIDPVKTLSFLNYKKFVISDERENNKN